MIGQVNIEMCYVVATLLSGENLPYPPGVLAAEIILLFVMVGIEAIRIFFGKVLSFFPMF